MIRTPLSAIALILALQVFASTAQAQAQTVFKCIDPTGGIAFQSTPCQANTREQRITIAPAPPPAASPEYYRSASGNSVGAGRSRLAARQEDIRSFVCRTRSGLLFYRHDRCPASIARRGTTSDQRSAAREPVQARKITRLEACRGMRSVGRDGREFDDAVSTYDRNLGRDVCRHY